ncbi:MAG: hypothetical protein C4528_01535 [Gammaproteobacteria bacterium]|nr:MAG: hypothetical protein C4528_01535 [Gammaproteobacteria bacterium]
MTISTKFDWPAIDDSQFEELLLAIVKAKGAVRAEFRKGPGDKGRDVQAWFNNRDSIGVETQDIYFFEAKHHVAGVSPDHIAGALAWAQAELPHSLILAASSHFTNPCRDNIDAWKRNNPRVKVSLWERPQIEGLVLSSSAVQDFAVSLGLLPPSIRGLLPAHPERYRPADDEVDSGLEMAYRYWLTEEDIEKLDTAATFIEDGGLILEENGLSDKFFEHARLGVPNWAMWLRLMRAQCLLQLSVRDYLFAQVSGAKPEELTDLASLVRKRVQLVSDIGEKSFHVD